MADIKELKFDSKEEEYFYWYLQELQKAGFIEEIIPQYPVIPLSDKKEHEVYKPLKRKTKFFNKTLLQEHIYTPDFTIVWAQKGFQLFVSHADTYKEEKTPFLLYITHFDKIKGKLVSIIEIKPSFDKYNMTKMFIVNQKWVYEKYGYFVQLVKPEELFKKTFTPARYIWTDSGSGRRKIKFKVRTLKEYLCQRKEILSLSIR